MALKYLPQGERKLSGTLSALLTAVATTMTVSNPPSTDKLPTLIEINPDAASPETVRAIAVAGNVVTIERGVYSSGVGTEHQANTPYKQKISSKHWDAVVDAVESGYLLEDTSLTRTKNSDTQFTITGIDRTGQYTAGRLLRLNASSYMIVTSSTFTGGNTVVNVSGSVVPTPITSIEVAVQPQGTHTNAFATSTGVRNSSYTYAEDAGADDAYEVTLSPIPAGYVAGMKIRFKPTTANTGPATLNVNNLGVKDIKKQVSVDLETGDIRVGQIVEVVYDGTSFQIVSSLDSSTITNKRITKRVFTEASSGTPTPNADTTDIHKLTALAVTAAFANPSGTPTDGQPLIITIKDNGTARALTWSATAGGYRAGTDVVLPAATIVSKTTYAGFVYNLADTKWDLVSVVENI